jgi:hypothetical protein
MTVGGRRVRGLVVAPRRILLRTRTWWAHDSRRPIHRAEQPPVGPVDDPTFILQLFNNLAPRGDESKATEQLGLESQRRGSEMNRNAGSEEKLTVYSKPFTESDPVDESDPVEKTVVFRDSQEKIENTGL